MVSKWSQFEIGQKTTNLAQSKICAKLMNNKEKLLGRIFLNFQNQVKVLRPVGSGPGGQ
jgi:hypothetical protein